MEDKYKVETTASLKSSLVQFSCDTTFHGLRYIAISQSLGRKYAFYDFIVFSPSTKHVGDRAWVVRLDGQIIPEL